MAQWQRPSAVTATNSTCWHLVLSCDGTVLAAADGAPSAWTGTQLSDRDDVPQDLKEAGRALLRRAHDSSSPVAATVLLESIHQAVCVTVVGAVPLRREPTDFRARLRSSLRVLRHQARVADIKFRLAVDARVPAVVLIDAERIVWAITALVGSALRYLPRGSRIRPGGSIAVEADYNPDNAEITLEVQDDGPGIPRDRLPLLFAAGQKRSRAGLALLMIREVVAAHGGAIDVQSETDTFRHGTTIRITLPVG
jgi:signal transduction histidine kinase